MARPIAVLAAASIAAVALAACSSTASGSAGGTGAGGNASSPSRAISASAQPGSYTPPPMPAHPITSSAAAAACRDFRTWYQRQGKGILADKDATLLASAVGHAPAGTLRKYLTVLRTDASTGRVARGTDLAAGERLVVRTDAGMVGRYCRSVRNSG